MEARDDRDRFEHGLIPHDLVLPVCIQALQKRLEEKHQQEDE